MRIGRKADNGMCFKKKRCGLIYLSWLLASDVYLFNSLELTCYFSYNKVGEAASSSWEPSVLDVIYGIK